MIKNIIVGDITSPENPSDIIIGMNTTLSEVAGIGVPFVRKIAVAHPIVLGGVLSFEFDRGRHLHMLICHAMGVNGWMYSDEHVRYGLDYLHHTEAARPYSIVNIGTGKIGKRDGANAAAIHTAIATSFLPMDLYVLDPAAQVVARREMPSLRAYRAWHPLYGEERVH